ncbi:MULTISPECIES: hypothetical protein [Bacillus]|uniref:hypothetical protein n=1 Tax=Bacillus TaxID=1386 RepID=UPI0007502057|nr:MULTISPECIES: hypothetical protein [Bacillus]BDG80128.1 putative membrane protein YozS [Bacillus subtilis]KUP39134.1 hypothetical protein AU385_19625 [Bacillus halotolerans]MBL4976619.1 hypothetical protein [Bacillus halotolerans]MCC8351870.1 hypothetical protein [Bacillus sp. AF23]OEC80567.1 hypothetical protein BCV60_20065 [Bacillus halotolerans]
MKRLAVLSSFTAIVISIIGQLMGMLDDSYAVGNAWFVGVLAGLITLLIFNDSQEMTKSYIISSSTILGILGVGFLYFPAALINILIAFKLNKKKEREFFNS